MSRYITKYMNIKKSKQPKFWNGGSKCFRPYSIPSVRAHRLITSGKQDETHGNLHRRPTNDQKAQAQALSILSIPSPRRRPQPPPGFP